MIEALRAFGSPLMGLGVVDIESPGVGLQIGVPPGRIDVLTKISGVDFGDASGRVEADFGENVVCSVIGVQHLLQNKRTAARPHDLADVDALERLLRLRK